MTVTDRQAGLPWTVRVASWSARHRFPVLGAWFVFTIGVFVASSAFGGTRTQAALSNDQRAKFESSLAYDVFNAGGQQKASSTAYVIVEARSGTVADPANAAGLEDIVGRLTALHSTVDGSDVPTFSRVLDPLKLPPAAGLVSPDRTAIRIVADMDGETPVIEQRVKPLPGLIDSLRAAHPELQIYELDNKSANDEISAVINRDIDGSLRITIPLTFLILLVAFGAVVAAAVPLVLAVTALLAAFGLLGIYSQVVEPVSPYAGQLIVLIGLAVAVDYSLFMVTRYRSERHRGGYDSHRYYPATVYLRRVALAVVAIVGLTVAAAVRIPIAQIAGGLVFAAILIRAIRRLMERNDQAEKLRAIQVASSTAGRAVFFSGLAVMISLAGLLLLDDPFFKSMAIATIAVVCISVVGSLTFLPATLAILGNGVNAGQVAIPFQALRLAPIVRLLDRNKVEGSGVWSALTRAVMNRAGISLVAGVVLLVALASPATQLHIGAAGLEAFPDSLQSVQALNLMNQKWPQGSTLEVQVVVTRANEVPTKAAIDEFSKRVLAIPGVSEPTSSTPSQDGKAVLLGYTIAGTQNDYANWDIVRQLRRDTVPAVFGPLGVQAYVTGDPAFALDQTSFYTDAMPLIILFVLGLSFLLLLVAFRSIVIAIKAIILNLLSTGAAYGLLTLVFQEGWFRDQLGFKPGVIETFIPIFIFNILFGLSMDYHVFILTRVKEAKDRGLSSNEAVAEGISITSGTITSAAAIMVVVFAVFVTLQIVVIRQMGFGLAVAVFLDATVVRSVLLPAGMRLLGDWNWWLPGFLRWLPQVTIEAEPTREPSPPIDGLLVPVPVRVTDE